MYHVFIVNMLCCDVTLAVSSVRNNISDVCVCVSVLCVALSPLHHSYHTATAPVANGCGEENHQTATSKATHPTVRSINGCLMCVLCTGAAVCDCPVVLLLP